MQISIPTPGNPNESPCYLNDAGKTNPGQTFPPVIQPMGRTLCSNGTAPSDPCGRAEPLVHVELHVVVLHLQPPQPSLRPVNSFPLNTRASKLTRFWNASGRVRPRRLLLRCNSTRLRSLLSLLSKPSWLHFQPWHLLYLPSVTPTLLPFLEPCCYIPRDCMFYAPALHHAFGRHRLSRNNLHIHQPSTIDGPSFSRQGHHIHPRGSCALSPC
jgi:hypothetical protein